MVSVTNYAHSRSFLTCLLYRELQALKCLKNTFSQGSFRHISSQKPSDPDGVIALFRLFMFPTAPFNAVTYSSLTSLYLDAILSLRRGYSNFVISHVNQL